MGHAIYLFRIGLWSNSFLCISAVFTSDPVQGPKIQKLIAVAWISPFFRPSTKLSFGACGLFFVRCDHCVRVLPLLYHVLASLPRVLCVRLQCSLCLTTT